MSGIQYTACFTGHRPQSLPCGFNEQHPSCLKIKHQLRRLIVGLIEKKNVTRFISGVAIGVDIWAAEIVLELKAEYPNITLEAAVPCRSQADRWNKSARERYNQLVSLCDKITLISEQYTPDCMMKRNRYMVDNSNYLVVVWNGKPSGTGNTVKYATEKGKKIYFVDAMMFCVRKL